MNSQGSTDLLKTIDNLSLVDRVEMNLIDFFIKKDFKPGDVIPKEMELASAMGVSRTVVRESLTRLKTLRIIEAVKHKGAIIKNPDLSALLAKSMIPRMLDDSTLKDIFEFRLVIEIGMAELIFQHVTPEDIAELEQIINIEPEKSNDVLFDIHHEIRFHGKFYEIAGNKTHQKGKTHRAPGPGGCIEKWHSRPISLSHAKPPGEPFSKVVWIIAILISSTICPFIFFH